MKIIAINSTLSSKEKNLRKNTNQQQNDSKTSLQKNGSISLYDKGLYKYQKTFSFKGTPWSMPNTSIYDAEDAIKTYDYLALGNYLDIK